MRTCRVCGCTDDRPCLIEVPGMAPIGCSWVAVDLCSECELSSDALEPAGPAPLLVDQHGRPLVFK